MPKALPAPRPERRQPIPLRPDAGALRESNVTSLVRACLASARAAASGGIITLAAVGHDRDAFALITRAASAPMTTLSGNLRTLVVDFVASLGPASAGAALLGQGLQLAFDAYSEISVPGFVADARNVSFVGEGRPIPVKQLTARGVMLEPRKLATIVVLTHEMLTSGNAEALVRDCLTRGNRNA